MDCMRLLVVGFVAERGEVMSVAGVCSRRTPGDLCNLEGTDHGKIKMPFC